MKSVPNSQMNYLELLPNNNIGFYAYRRVRPNKQIPKKIFILSLDSNKKLIFYDHNYTLVDTSTE